MAKPAPTVRKALYDATALLSAAGTTSREVVDYVKAKSPTAIIADQNALVDLGLMVLAGRVATVKLEDDRQLDIFDEGAPKRFMKFGRKRIETRSLTLGQWQELTAKPKKHTNKTKSHDDLIAAYFEDMATKGLSKNTALGAYLDKR